MIDRDIKQFILKALLHAKDQPINDDTLRQLVRSAFQHVAIAEPDLEKWINDLHASGLVVRSDDAVFGPNWVLSLAGKPKAQQLR
jgi:hypothetical protein